MTTTTIMVLMPDGQSMAVTVAADTRVDVLDVKSHPGGPGAVWSPPMSDVDDDPPGLVAKRTWGQYKVHRQPRHAKKAS